MTTSVCVLGLGLIGGSLMRAGQAAGREVFGYNRSIEAVKSATADGFDATEDLTATLKRAALSEALIVPGGAGASTKSMTGHLLGAAGAIEAIATIMGLRTGIIPRTINHFTNVHVFDTRLNLTFNTAQRRNLNAVLSNTFGFGGHNASVIFKKIE